LNEIIGIFTDPLFYKKADEEWERSFILLVPTLTTFETLTLKLIERYFVPLDTTLSVAQQEKLQEMFTIPIRRRVCLMMHKLISVHWHAMSTSAKRLVRVFILIHEESKYRNFLAVQVVKTMHNKITIPPPQLSRGVTSHKTIDIYEYTPQEIAKSLVLLEWENFKYIQPEEFLKQAWTKRPEKAPYIRAMIDRFNKITTWIVSQIVGGEKIKLRVKRFTKFIKIAEELKNLGSYHTFMAVLSGLTENAVYRLKFTIAELPPRFKELYLALADIMSVENSYKNYREHLSNYVVNSKLPTIPYIGVYLRDLTYFDDIKGDDGRINTRKVQSIYGIISQVQLFQDHKEGYLFETNDKLDYYLRHFPGTGTLESYLEISKKREPKNATRTEIE